MDAQCDLFQVVVQKTRVFLFFLAVFLFLSSVGLTQTMNVSGYVRDNNGDYLPGANIVVQDSELGTMSNQNGYFVMSIPKTNLIILKVSYIGYKPAKIKIIASETPTFPMQIFLELDALNFSPIEIIGVKLLEKQIFIEPSFKVIRRSDINAISALDGNDVFRAIQNEPGVNSLNELSNQLYIRGGSPDQNLVLINGAPIYQPFHLFGLASSICGNSIDYVKYSSGGFSAQYGDRMSSVLDIVTQPGTDSLTTKLDWNIFSTDVTMAGSFGRKLRWRVTGRRSYYDKLGKMFDFDFPYYFYDLESKISYIPKEKTLISLSVFISGDNYSTSKTSTYYNSYYSNSSDLSLAHADSNTYYKISKSGIKWINKLISLQYHRRFSSLLDNETRFYVSVLDQNYEYLKRFQGHKNASPLTLQYVAKRNEQYNFTTEPTDAKTIFADYGLQSLFEYTPEGFYEITFGYGYSYKNLNYRWQIPDFNLINRYINIFMDFPPDSMDYQQGLHNVFGIMEATFKPVRNILNIRFGARPTWYSHCS
ncbi:MAG: carboxypeptidase-like regulatory domain-containing protein, partial [Candidatus Neomarinimicrobiota bacterium]